MKVTLKDVNTAFDDLIHERKTHEEITDWAIKLQSIEGSGDLKYEPKSEEDIIWKAITYLSGVDLKDIDGTYLHSIENFIDFKSKTP